MTEELFVVRPIVESDAAIVAEIHITELRTHYSGRTGRNLLRCHYRTLANACGAVCYVFVDEKRAILGFICGVWDAQCLRRNLLSREWLRLVFSGGAHLLMHLRRSAKLIWRFACSVTPFREKAVAGGNRQDYELRPIAVRADSRGRGVAEALLNRLLNDARSRGFASVYLRTEMDNARANAFYRKHGFSLESTTDGYNQYRIALSEPACPSHSCLQNFKEIA